MTYASINSPNIESWQSFLFLKFIHSIQWNMLIKIKNNFPQMFTLFLLIEEIIAKTLTLIARSGCRPGIGLIGYDFLVARVIQLYIKVTVSPTVEVDIAIFTDISKRVIIGYLVNKAVV